MRKGLVPLMAMLCMSVCVPLHAQEGSQRDLPKFRGDLAVLFEAKHKAQDDTWVFDYPIYGNVGLLYEREGVEAALSLDIINELDLGPTYILGGRDSSFLKLGFYTETWRTGYSWSVIDILNERDERYPNYIFYRNYLRPNPMLYLSVGGKDWAQQFIVSQKTPSTQVKDALLAARSLLTQERFETAIGIIRLAGEPPPLFLFTANTTGGRSSAWLELGWWIYQHEPDTVNGVMGGRQDFSTAHVIAELIVDYSDLLLYLEQESRITELVLFNAQGYTYLNKFSLALKSYITTSIEKHTAVELGFILFFGEKGTYFSRYTTLEENDNQIYLRLSYNF
jgi:hypothetical protein